MRKALVVVDMQYGFMNEITSYLGDKTVSFIKEANQDPETPMFDLVIATQYVNHENSACYKLEGWKDCMSGSEDTKILPGILELCSEEAGDKLVIKKDKFTCYTDEFLRIIKQYQIDQLYFTGVNTGCCVFHSALDAYENVLDTYVIEDLCGSTNGVHYHDIGIELLATLITPSRILKTEEVLRAAECERLLAKADRMAEKAHEGQVDKAGADYISHPRTVASFVTDTKEKIVALLHDTLEDTELSENEIGKHFGSEILEAVKTMTHKDGEDYFAYIRRVAKNPISAAVKKADLRHNMDLRRIGMITQKDVERVKKYQKAYDLLEELHKQ